MSWIESGEKMSDSGLVTDDIHSARVDETDTCSKTTTEPQLLLRRQKLEILTAEVLDSCFIKALTLFRGGKGRV